MPFLFYYNMRKIEHKLWYTTLNLHFTHIKQQPFPKYAVQQYCVFGKIIIGKSFFYFYFIFSFFQI